MANGIGTAFRSWLDYGPRRVGQIAITPLAVGSWDLRHIADAGRTDLETAGNPEVARHIANIDDAGKYRPLKTAPNLARGWRLQLSGPDSVQRAVDYLYPAMVGVWHSQSTGQLTPVVLRETLARQTGMYRITQKITDTQARETVDIFCSGCLKHRLWEIATLNPDPLKPTKDELPMLCHEACNLLVAEIRKVVKNAAAPVPATAAT